MPLPQFLNGVQSTTYAAGATASAINITPDSVVGFPTVPQFTVLVVETNELLLVTGVASGVWTVQRGYGGSAAATIPAGATLTYSLTREMLLMGFPQKVDEVVCVGTETSVTFTLPTWLPTTYGTLHVRAQARSAKSSTSWEEFGLRCNGDSGSNYEHQRAYSGGTTLAADRSTAQTSFFCGEISTDLEPANFPGALDVWVHDFQRTAFFHALRAFSTHRDTTSGPLEEIMGGFWRSTAAITSLTCLPRSGSAFKANSLIQLYVEP